jgi:hypothetical protein
MSDYSYPRISQEEERMQLLNILLKFSDPEKKQLAAADKVR